MPPVLSFRGPPLHWRRPHSNLGNSCRRPQREHTRSAPTWLRRCCRFLRVPTVGLGRSRISGIDQSLYTPCCQVFLHVGNAVVRRQDTSRARVEVVEPLVGNLRVAQVSDSCHLLPCPFGEERVLQTPESRPISEPRRLRLELRRTEPALPGR